MRNKNIISRKREIQELDYQKLVLFCVEATTDISQVESGVTLLLIGDGNLDDLFSHIG